MSDFTVEAVTEPVTDPSQWKRLREVLETVPGTVLIEDAEMPGLVFRVEAINAFHATRFVEGITSLMDVTVVSGSVRLAEDELWEHSDRDEPEVSPMVRKVRTWVEDGDKALA